MSFFEEACQEKTAIVNIAETPPKIKLLGGTKA